MSCVTFILNGMFLRFIRVAACSSSSLLSLLYRIPLYTIPAQLADLKLISYVNFPLLKPVDVQRPPFISTPMIPEHFMRGNTFSDVSFSNIVLCLWVLLLLYYPFALSAIISSSFSITEVEMKWKLFFLEAQSLITVPWFVYS